MTVICKNNRDETITGDWTFDGQVDLGDAVVIADDENHNFLGTVQFSDHVTMADAKNVILNATTGTKIGTATTQKLGFYNATPVAQRSGAAGAAVVTTAATQTTPYGFATQAQADALVTLVNELRATLVALGVHKGSA